MQITARGAALTALERCRRDNAWSGAVIEKLISKYTLERREAALAARLCLGVLQNGILCDYYIDSFCDRKLEPKVRDILRLGVYQILMLDRIPDRAAVNECVELCRAVGYDRASGLVNAVLRKVCAQRDSLPQLPPHGSIEYLSVKYSFPTALVKRLSDEKGYEFTEAFLKASNSPPPLTIQLNTLRIESKAYWMALERTDIVYKLIDALPDCVMLEGGNVSELPGYEEGLFYVQDAAARASVELAAPECGMNVLDACSAPGGKSFAAALRMKNSGNILACDIHEKKLPLISTGAKRLGIDIIRTRCLDARVYDDSLSGKFDLVIADVPCSGYGVIRKKPEIRAKSLEESAGLPQIQLDILNNLSRYVKAGGTLLYSTCTVLEAENEDVVRNFLSGNKAFELEARRSFYPNTDGTDGFFAAKLRRKP